jgi:integrase
VALANIEGRKGLVFGYRDRWAVYDDWHPACQVIGLSDFTPHDCRHTWATWMRQYGGLDLRGLPGTGTWRDIHSVLRYQHVTAGEESRAADKLPLGKNVP